jgi:AAA15 family ATPase/GTPase
MEFPESMPEELRERFSQSIRDGLRVVAEHPVFDGQGVQVGVADFPLTSEESQGTQKLFAYSGPILDTLERGSTLIVDEMDARFHPLLTQALVRLFQSPETNPKDAQMVFIAHDTNLLDSRRLRRDQIWFVEKDRYGASHLYALSDFKGIRKGDLFEEQYIRGRYGAIPFLGGLRRLLTDVPDAEPTVNLTFGEANVPA